MRTFLTVKNLSETNVFNLSVPGCWRRNGLSKKQTFSCRSTSLRQPARSIKKAKNGCIYGGITSGHSVG